MARLCAALALLLVAAVSSRGLRLVAQPVHAPVPEPNFPKSFTTQEADALAIAQGATTGPDGSVCCNPKSTCKVQTEYQDGVSYFDGENNQTRFDSPGQIIVTDYKIHKEMLVAANGTCLQYCPTQFGWDPNPFWVDGDDAKTLKDLGNMTIDGVVCRHYQWKEQLTHLITMQETDLYVNLGGPYAIPVQQKQIIEPFGQQLGVENTNWSYFKPGQPDASLFKVTGITACPESPNCGQSSGDDDDDQSAFTMAHERRRRLSKLFAAAFH